MKHRIIIFIGIIVLISACSETQNKSQNKEISVIEMIDTDELTIKEIGSVLQGIWLPPKYVQKILNTKSANIASHSIPKIAELQIDPKKLKPMNLILVLLQISIANRI